MGSVYRFDDGRVIDMGSYPIKILGEDDKWRPMTNEDGTLADLKDAVKLSPVEGAPGSYETAMGSVVRLKDGRVVDLRSAPFQMLGEDGKWRPMIKGDCSLADTSDVVILNPKEVAEIDARSS